MGSAKTENSVSISSQAVKEAIKEFNLGKAKIQQINAILTIGEKEKLGLLPFICQIISEQSLYDYYECAEVIERGIELKNIEKLKLYLRAEIKDAIDKIADFSDDYSIIQKMESRFEMTHPKEKIAMLYYVANKGGLYSQLASGSRMSRLDEDPDFLFDMPRLAKEVLQKGVDNLDRMLERNSSYAKYIRSNMQALVVEARVKLILSGLQCGDCASEYLYEIEWLKKFYPKNHRWIKLKAYKL